MMNAKQYLPVSIALALVFAVFNIGLPVVMASCPMMAVNRVGDCCQLPSSGGGVQLSKYSSSTCCKVTIAAERNRNEFLQSILPLRGLDTKAPVVILPASLQLGTQFPAELSVHSFGDPLYLPEDIPILISSLLI